MSPQGFRLIALTALLSVALPAAASAQIYSWREADGSLVLSTTPKVGATKTFAVANVASGIRTTRAPYSRRSEEFEPLIAEYSAAHRVRPDLVRAVIQAESAFDPLARSVKGAMGLMQLMPATAAELGVSNPYDPAQNIRGGVTYLKSLLLQYSDDEELALAAYNAGPTAVNRYGAVPPYRETRNYIKRIKGNAEVRRAPAREMYRTVTVVGGREVVTFSTKPSTESTRVHPSAIKR